MCAGRVGDESRRGWPSESPTRDQPHSRSIMTATYTFDVFSSLDGFGAASGNWTGYWGKQGPELLDHRLAVYDTEQRMVFGANTYRAFAQMLASSTEESEARDPWVTQMRSLPARWCRPRRPSRPRPGDALPCDHRSDRAGPDLRRCGRLRPRA